MQLRKLNLEDARKEYAFFQNNEANDHGFCNEYKNVSYEEFLLQSIPERLEAEKGLRLKEGYVPDVYYFLFDDEEEIVGVYKLRLQLNDFLRDGPGHVGYLIDRDHRQKGYGKKGLALLIDLIRKEHLVEEDELYFEAYNDNIPSMKTILANGGYVHHKDGKCTYLRIRLR